MKTLSLVLVVSAALFLSSCSSDQHKEHADGTATAAAQKEYYTCPMHPSVISDRPGACPVCGMALVRKTAPQEMTSKDMTNLSHVTLSPTQRVLANITTEKIERRSISKEINAVGVVQIAEPLQATMTARFRGRIEKLHVNYTGEVVKQGQPLFELYSPDLLSAKRELTLAFDALNNARVANDSQTIQVQEQLLSAIRERLRVHFGMTENQITEVETERTAKSTVTFFSPIHGTVLSKQVLEGQYVDEGSVLYQLADLSRVWIYLDVYEQDVRFIKVGQSIQITTEANPNEPFQGRVTFIDPVVNSETRTVRVRTEFSNPSGKLRPEMFVTAHVKLPVAKALVIPATAVLFTGKRTVVWVEVGENTFEPRVVTLGISSGGDYEVLSGLKGGEIIAATGGYLIDSESTLQQPSSANPHAGHEMKK